MYNKCIYANEKNKKKKAAMKNSISDNNGLQWFLQI